MPTTEPLPERIAQYRILHSLGSGGMAKVYLAQDERLQRQVALKLLPRHEADTVATEARFMQEARAAARLDHPNVCSIYEVGEAPEGNFIAMQLVEGETLAARMGRRRLDLKESLDIAIQVLDALEEAHAKGIIHRDIKPANIMLTPKDQVKVLDFGLAKTTVPGGDALSMGLTQSGMVVGTVPYMSPEQLKSEPVDGRSDLFSLGTLLYEMAAGSRPFQAKSGVEVMSAILKEVPPLLDHDGDLSSPSLPPPLRRILRHALEKEPSHRYLSAAAFRDELVALRQGLGHSSDELTRAQPSASGVMAALLQSTKVVRRHQGLRWSLVTVLAILGMGALAWVALPAILPGRPAVASVAVLPIQNATGDPELDWMCEGMVEQLIQQISRLPKLKVIARSSALRYRGPDLDLPAVGRDLGVQTLLVGRLLRHQGQVSLSFELVQAADRRHLWGQRIERPVEHLVETQNLLADELGLALAGRLGEPERLALAGGRLRTSSEAYQLYLKGRHHADKWTPEDLGRAMAYFEQALTKDPSFALAHAGVANAYWGMSGTFKSSGEVMPKVRDEARKALALDPNLAEAHTALGIATFILDRNHAAAESSLRRGIELNPNSSIAHSQYGYFLLGHGRNSDSLQEMDRAVSLDPQSPNSFIFRALSHFYLGDPKRCLVDARRALTMDPNFWFAWMAIAGSEFHEGQIEDALRDIDKAIVSGSSQALACKGFFLGRSGRKTEARRILESLKELERSGKTFVSPTHIAYVQASLGFQGEAIENLRRAETLQDETVLMLGVDPFLDPLRSSPEFRKLLQKVGLAR